MMQQHRSDDRILLVHILQLLRERDANPHYQLHLAADRSDLEAVRLVLECSCASCQDTPLAQKVMLGDNAGWTALHSAAEQGALDVVRELLSAGAMPNCHDIDGSTPLMALRH